MNRTPRYTGTKIKDVLAAQGRRQDWLAGQVGVSGSTVTRWLKGDLSISHEHAEKVARALGVPLFLVVEFRKENDMESITERIAVA